jgi:hypothetical protein
MEKKLDITGREKPKLEVIPVPVPYFVIGIY